MKGLLLSSLCGLFATTTWAATNLLPLTATELLDKFAAAQAQLKSFIAHYELNRQDAVSSPPWKGSYSRAGETRFDGRQISERARLWGQITPDTVRSKAEPYYKSRLFDGQWSYSLEQPFWRLDDKRAHLPQGVLGTLSLRRPSASPEDLVEALDLCDSAVALCLGVPPHDNKRFDGRIRDAASLRVRDKLDPAGAEPSPCYVLEADTPQGRYTVWLDPAHGFQMAKVILERRPGHQRTTPGHPYTLIAGERDVSVVDGVRFAKSGEVWVPIEASGALDNTFAKVGSTRMRFQIKITKFLLNPDHEALRSFVPDDIRNGATVFITSAADASGGLLKYEWHDGQVLDSNGHVAFDSTRKRTPSAKSTPGGTR
jgi:hypothetical protein